MNTTVQDLKMILMGIMEDVFLPSDINATQQMGVQLSSAVKREGVLIIQNQNIEVLARVIPRMVKALRMCDDIAIPVAANTTPAIEWKAPVPDDPVDECCNFLFEQKIKWSDMQNLMKSRYLEFVTGKFKTRVEAARMLGLGPTYLSKLSQAEKHDGTLRIERTVRQSS